MSRTTSNDGQRNVNTKLASSSANGESTQDRRDKRRQPPGSAVQQPQESRINRIASRAHEIYEARGGEHGKAMEDWLQAEREVDAEMEASGNAGE
jgi:hypothetical protein